MMCDIMHEFEDPNVPSGPRARKNYRIKQLQVSQSNAPFLGPVSHCVFFFCLDLLTFQGFQRPLGAQVCASSQFHDERQRRRMGGPI